MSKGVESAPPPGGEGSQKPPSFSEVVVQGAKNGRIFSKDGTSGINVYTNWFTQWCMTKLGYAIAIPSPEKEGESLVVNKESARKFFNITGSGKKLDSEIQDKVLTKIRTQKETSEKVDSTAQSMFTPGLQSQVKTAQSHENLEATDEERAEIITLLRKNMVQIINKYRKLNDGGDKGLYSDLYSNILLDGGNLTLSSVKLGKKELQVEVDRVQSNIKDLTNKLDEEQAKKNEQAKQVTTPSLASSGPSKEQSELPIIKEPFDTLAAPENKPKLSSETPIALKSTFRFNEHVDVKVFKTTLGLLGVSVDKIAEKDLSAEFNKIVVDHIVTTRSLDSERLIERFGFQSQDAIDAFLNVPSIAEALKKEVTLPAKRLSTSLLLELQETYKEALATQESIGRSPAGTDVLLTLFPCFEFFKKRSNEEISTLKMYFLSYDLSSYEIKDLKTFRDDLRNPNLNLLSFEKKYAGCFNGFLQNIIKPILDKEKLYTHVHGAPPV